MKKSIAINDDKKDERTPIIVGRTIIKFKVLNNVNNSTSPDIETAGIPTRNESFAAVCLFIPENNAEVKVIPDLETPGNTARDCDIPSKIISLKLIVENDFFLLPKISDIASKKAIIIEIIAIENKPLR